MILCTLIELIGTVAISLHGACLPASPVNTVVIDRAATQLQVWSPDGTLLEQSPVGVGAPGWETPAGTFHVVDELDTTPWVEYGPVALVTDAVGRVDGGFDGTIAIHGTDKPALLPGAVSHGCVRVPNGKVRSVAGLVDPGATVIII